MSEERKRKGEKNKCFFFNFFNYLTKEKALPVVARVQLNVKIVG